MSKKNVKKLGQFEIPELRNSSKSLLANIRFASVDEPVRTIVVTSTTPDEGKTATATNLACAIASAGHTVLVVDCDMRRRCIGSMLGIHPQHGLYAVLSGEAKISEAVTPTPYNNLFFLDCEPNIPSPPDLLSTHSFKSLVKSLRSMYNYVILDAPPLTPFVDAAIIGSVVDGTILCVRDHATKRKLVEGSVAQLRAANARILGTVMTFTAAETSDYYYAYYTRDGKRVRGGGRGGAGAKGAPGRGWRPGVAAGRGAAGAGAAAGGWEAASEGSGAGGWEAVCANAGNAAAGTCARSDGPNAKRGTDGARACPVSTPAPSKASWRERVDAGIWGDARANAENTTLGTENPAWTAETAPYGTSPCANSPARAAGQLDQAEVPTQAAAAAGKNSRGNSWRERMSAGGWGAVCAGAGSTASNAAAGTCARSDGPNAKRGTDGARACPVSTPAPSKASWRERVDAGIWGDARANAAANAATCPTHGTGFGAAAGGALANARAAIQRKLDASEDVFAGQDVTSPFDADMNAEAWRAPAAALDNLVDFDADYDVIEPVITASDQGAGEGSAGAAHAAAMPITHTVAGIAVMAALEPEMPSPAAEPSASTQVSGANAARSSAAKKRPVMVAAGHPTVAASAVAGAKPAGWNNQAAATPSAAAEQPAASAPQAAQPARTTAGALHRASLMLSHTLNAAAKSARRRK